MNPRIAFLSDGKLFLHTPGEPAREVASPFAESIRERTERIRKKSEWKTKGPGAAFMGGMLWGAEETDSAGVNVRCSGVSGAGGNLFYTLLTDTVGGLFRYDPETGEEHRIFHREGFLAGDLHRHPQTGWIVCSRANRDGTVDIAVLKDDSGHPYIVTAGDSVDEAPAWIPGEDARIVFQSAGVARNEEGYVVGLGPVAVCTLDPKKGGMETVLANETYDYFLPRVDQEGNLYTIKRPYRHPDGMRFSLARTAGDAILFPFRLLRAVFDYLNFFSLVYSKKPLTTAGGRPLQGVDEKTLYLRGRRIDAKKALKRARPHEETPALVPPDWQLIRIDETGAERVLAESVVCYDVTGEGEIVYSNGSAVFMHRGKDRNDRLVKAFPVEHVTVLSNPLSDYAHSRSITE